MELRKNLLTMMLCSRTLRTKKQKRNAGLQFHLNSRCREKEQEEEEEQNRMKRSYKTRKNLYPTSSIPYINCCKVKHNALLLT